jgi:predicted PurR-regulated permease PerM
MTQTVSQFYPRVFALVAVGVLGYVSFKVLAPFFEPLMWAGLLAFLLFPVNERLRRAVREQKGRAALLLTLAVILVIVIPASLFIGIFITQASDLVGRLRAGGSFQIVQFSDLMKIPVLERLVQNITHHVPVTVQQIEGWSVEGGKRLLQTLISYGGSIFTGALGAFISDWAGDASDPDRGKV